jgi:hypothetical protein
MDWNSKKVPRKEDQKQKRRKNHRLSIFFADLLFISLPLVLLFLSFDVNIQDTFCFLWILSLLPASER